jgi:hemoglobin
LDANPAINHLRKTIIYFKGLNMNNYGTLDSSYKAAGEETGVRKLVDDFYHQMETQKRGKHIRAMHKEDLHIIKDKLSLFLMGWLGGPRKYGEKYGGISIPMVHQHLVIGEEERDAWIFCMNEALKQQDYETDFKQYLIEQLAFPAERIRQVSQMAHS